MKYFGVVSFTLILAIIPRPLGAQWLDTTVYLGDSLYHFNAPHVFISDPLNNKVFAGGWGLVAIDGSTLERSCVSAVGGVYSLSWNPINEKIYAGGQYPYGSCLYVIDAATNAVRNVIYVNTMAVAYDSVNDQVFCADGQLCVVVVNGTGDTIDATILVGNEPHALTYNPNLLKVYCALQSSNGIAVIDAATSIFIKYICIPAFRLALICNPLNNKVYATDLYSDSVIIIDCMTDSIVSAVTVGNQPRALAYNSVNNKIYCASDTGCSVSIIDGETNNLITTVTDTDGFVSLSYNPVRNKIYCSHANRPAITVIDGASNLIDTCLYLDHYPVAPTYHENTNSIYCGDEWNSRITIINATTYAVNATIGVRQELNGFAFNPVNNKLYCVDFFSHVLALNDLTHAVTESIPTGVDLNSIMCNPVVNKLYCGGHDQIVVIDPTADSVIARITFGLNPVPLLCNQAGNKLYCSYCPPSPSSLPMLMVIECLGDSVIKTFPIQEPRVLGYNTLQNKIYCASGNGTINSKISIINGAVDSVMKVFSDTTRIMAFAFNPTTNKIYGAGYRNLTVIDGATDSVITMIRVTRSPAAIACNPLNNKIYCVDGSSPGAADTMCIIDGLSDSVIAKLAVGDNPSTLFYNPVNNKIYCCNTNDNTVIVVDGATDAIVAVIPVGDLPQSLAWSSSLNQVYVLNHNSKSVSIIQDINAVAENIDSPPISLRVRTFPNPFTRQTTFFLDAGPSAMDVTLKIYDACGRLVRELYHSDRSNGPMRIAWDGKDLAGRRAANGVYFARLTADGRSVNTAVLHLR